MSSLGCLSGRTRASSFCRLNEISLIAEHLRESLHEVGLIQNRKYHLRTYNSCIVGKELVDWLLKNKHCESRETATNAIRILQQHAILHHVCDDHEFKDQLLFYRFRRDDDTYLEDRDLTLFYRALDLYRGLSRQSTGVIRSYQQDGELYRNAFQGAQFVDFLLQDGTVCTREEGVVLGRRLLENDTIRHVTDDYHFRDDRRLLYQFTIDYSRRRHLSEVFTHAPRIHRTASQDSSGSRQFFTPTSSPSQTPESVRRHSSPLVTPRRHHSSREENAARDPGDDNVTDRRRTHSGDSGNETDSSETHVEAVKTRSVLLRHATVHELQSPDTPYVKQTIKIQSDPVGYGFVIRGENPTYVQAVDPMGPAANAGLKVRQYIYSVNGNYVLSSDHKHVGSLIMHSVNHVTLVVMTHKRDAGM